MRVTELANPNVSRLLRRGALLGVGLMLLAGGAARAGGLPSPLDLHREVRRHVGDLLRHLERIPDRIERRHERHLEVFFGGRPYYAPHRHHHVVYSFPVWIDGVVEYRPYTYCEGRLFGASPVRPRVWVEWDRDGRGAWCDHCHGWYPQRHACFVRPSRYDRHVERYYHGHDHHGRERRYDRYGDDHHGHQDRDDRDDDHRRWKRRGGHDHD